jgi:hypothetical protein
MRFGLILLFLVLSLNILGQGFKANAIAGISTSQVSSDGLGGFNKFGLKLGASVFHKVNDGTRAEYAIYYIDKGSRNSENFFKIDLSYIESSLTLQKSSKGIIYEAGLLFAVLIDGATYNSNGVFNSQFSTFSKYDFGATIGAGVKLKSKVFMFWEINNTIPLFPIQEHSEGISVGLNKGKYNSVFSISLRYLLSDE